MDTNPLCACGCGEPVTGKAKYLKGHRNRLLDPDPYEVTQDTADAVAEAVDAVNKHWELTRKQATHPDKGAAI